MNINNLSNTAPNKINYILPFILFANLMPIYGVLNFGWTLFSVLYIYWLELLIITFFDFLKIVSANGDDSTNWMKLVLGGKLILIRVGIFFFYLTFLITFIGIMLSAKNEDVKDLVTMADALFLKSTFYKITLLSVFISHTIDFYFSFIASNKYKNTTAQKEFIFLDAHILVVHIVIVLSVFLYKGLTEKMNIEHTSAIVACVSLFAIIKIVVDYAKAVTNNKDLPNKPTDIFI
ncbi:MAG: hypothetical protein KA457_08160 [Chitinophagales bacterium]|jgi:hypothetical protein|nr:hypothetical protein [Chitinophagales bacterium]